MRLRQYRRRGVSFNNDALMPGYLKVSKSDLVPSNTLYHRISGISEFLCSVFDRYAREYGEYFQD